MPRRIFRCTRCSRYTLRRDVCPVCGAPVRPAHPPRWSPDDRLSRYRVRMREHMRRTRNV